MASKYYINKRLSYDHELCTVRYIGQVQGTKGDWLGVEWDDASRGKHDGQHNGKKYFSCLSKSPTPASFVRPTRAPDPSKSFTDAVHDKYAYDEDTSGLGLKPVWISGKEAEEIGFDKIRQKLANLHALRVVIVDGFSITRPEARQVSDDVQLPDDVVRTCPKITDLDVSRNLFEAWDEVLDIARQLPTLQTIKADGNRFSNISTRLSPDVLSGRPFTHVKSLTLDDALLQWGEISMVCKTFTNLASLSANGNQYADISSESIPMSITTLTLERNDFATLTAVAPLSALKNLKQLSLKSNKISAIGSETPRFPESLSYLDLSYNAIESWSFIDALGGLFPGLTSLRVAHNPLFEEAKSSDGHRVGQDEGYMLTVARLGKLQVLNFSNITAKERLNAEMYYLGLVAKELSISTEDTHSGILERNPRYKELCGLHGDPLVQTARQEPKINQHALAARLVTLQFTLAAPVREAIAQDRLNGLLENNALLLELPKSLNIYSILGILARKLHLQPLLLGLVWETGEENISSDGWFRGEDIERSSSFREELLAPKSRQLGTWIESNEAKIRVEWDAVVVKRQAAYVASIKAGA